MGVEGGRQDRCKGEGFAENRGGGVRKLELEGTLREAQQREAVKKAGPKMSFVKEQKEESEFENSTSHT